MKFEELKIQIGDGAITARSTKRAESLMSLVALSGGPGLSGKYFDESIIEISSKLNANVISLDLPNHNNEEPPFKNLNYPKTVFLLRKAISHLQLDDIILVGHSFGARVCLDLLEGLQDKTKKMILASMPAVLQPSKEFIELSFKRGFENFSLKDETDFITYWEGMIDAFVYSNQQKNEILNKLTAETYALRCIGMTENLPDFKEVKSASVRYHVPTLYIQGQYDYRLTELNLATIESVFPEWTIQMLNNCGHFPMLECKDRFVKTVIKYLE